MGMRMAEFVEHMKEKDKKLVEDPVVVSIAPPSPPPPPPGAAPVQFEIGTPRGRSRSRSAAADPTPVQEPIRDPSIASTIGYPSAQPRKMMLHFLWEPQNAPSEPRIQWGAKGAPEW